MQGFGLLVFRDSDNDAHAVNILDYSRIVVVAESHVQLITPEGRADNVPLAPGEAGRIIAWLEGAGELRGGSAWN